MNPDLSSRFSLIFTQLWQFEFLIFKFKVTKGIKIIIKPNLIVPIRIIFEPVQFKPKILKKNWTVNIGRLKRNLKQKSDTGEPNFASRGKNKVIYITKICNRRIATAGNERQIRSDVELNSKQKVGRFDLLGGSGKKEEELKGMEKGCSFANCGSPLTTHSLKANGFTVADEIARRRSGPLWPRRTRQRGEARLKRLGSGAEHFQEVKVNWYVSNCQRNLVGEINFHAIELARARETNEIFIYLNSDWADTL